MDQVPAGPNLPPGGVVRPSSYPQQTRVPSVLTPQVCSVPPSMAMKVPAGAVARPSGLKPQHSTVPSVLIPQ